MHSHEGTALEDRVQVIQKAANELFGKRVNWAIFFREILGTHGLVRKLYPDEKSLTEFQITPEFSELQAMLEQLRDINIQSPSPDEEATRVITVRLPSCLHDALKKEAKALDTSMNQLCISKLLARIDAKPSPVSPAHSHRDDSHGDFENGQPTN
jgi:predicted HicB family RNase H-like nuclease